MLILLLIVTLFKSAMNVAILRLLGEPWPRAWLAGVAIGQVGEFSFVLIATAVAAGLVQPSASRLIVSVIALSLMLSPFWLLTARRLENLSWPKVQSFRALWRGVFGQETRLLLALALASWRLLLTGFGKLRRVSRRRALPAAKTAAVAQPDPTAVIDAEFRVVELPASDGQRKPDAEHGD